MAISFPDPICSFLDAKDKALSIYKSGPGTRVLLAQSLLERRQSPVLLARDDRELAELRSIVRLLHPAEEKRPFEQPWIIFPPYQSKRPDPSAWARRMACLFALAQGGARGVVATVDNLAPLWPSRTLFDTHHLPLAVGEDISPDMILEQAVLWGYERTALVTRPGEMAMRGGVLDIYSPTYRNPLRLEFFGDILEDMRLFDPYSQRSRMSLKESIVIPVAPVIPAPDLAAEAESRWEEARASGVLAPEQRQELLRSLEDGARGMHPGAFYAAPSRFEDWLPAKPALLACSMQDLETLLQEEEWAARESDEETAGGEDKDGGDAVRTLERRPWKEVLEVVGRQRRVLFEDLVMGAEKRGVDLPERSFGSFEDLFRKHVAEGGGESLKDRPWHVLVEALKEWKASMFQTILGFHSERSRKKFLHLAAQEGLAFSQDYSSKVPGLFALVSPFQRGLEVGWANVRILGEEVLQPARQMRPPAPDKGFKGLDTYAGLEPGDLLVHRDYGLGRFKELTRMQVGDVGNDCLLLLYSGDDKLYVPVDRLGLVQRYKGPEETTPVLDKLGGLGWTRTREKARKAIAEIAKDLVEMYAYRRIAKGYSYGPLNEMYREFEASFGFEETPDQAKAIADVLADMERGEPMDRLVCGDVGFGKTEVAMRAAIRAALEGRQVALLCPTTVLAEQHFQNFRARFGDFPVNVGMVSRFVPPAKQKIMLEAARRGQVDVLIGTHRLLSKDVLLPSLGLLILDEEQRFGVKHKEKLKQLKRTIDVLTLTATPIPRTLQLSLSGIRGLSVIETPPSERKPVQNALIERDPLELKGIVHRELARGGQVFWVHNRVRELARVRDFVQTLAPEARIGVAHGQMSERVLEETMHGFWHGELDILLCTSIIESGLDFPRANTLIVDQAHMFGLAQLYQLRGRVGRSDRQAYAYFVVNDVGRIQETARKRLKIVLDMDYLGAGFQVAMEDLRLRGAGNILGESQSGSIAKVGLDLYLEMLEQEVGKLRGKPLREETEPELSIGFPALIPESYMPDSGERLKYYKAFSSARDERTLRDLEDEVRDRFGPLPGELLDFIEVLALKRLLSVLQVVKADLYPTRLRLNWSEDTRAVDPARLIEWVSGLKNAARMIPPSTLELRLRETGTVRSRLQHAAEQLAGLKRAGPDDRPEADRTP